MVHQPPLRTIWIYHGESHTRIGQALSEGLARLKLSILRKMERLIMVEWLKTELMNILRWEDDGGKIVEIRRSALDQKRRNPMNTRVGLWIDRKKAVIVSIVDNIEGKRIITSDMENYVLYSTVVPGDGSPENVRDRRFWNHLSEYYDKIVAHIGDAAEIQIFGPEVAKYELQKRLESEGLGQNIVSLEEADKMTDHQIATKVQKRFPIRSRFELF